MLFRIKCGMTVQHDESGLVISRRQERQQHDELCFNTIFQSVMFLLFYVCIFQAAKIRI